MQLLEPLLDKPLQHLSSAASAARTGTSSAADSHSAEQNADLKENNVVEETQPGDTRLVASEARTDCQGLYLLPSDRHLNWEQFVRQSQDSRFQADADKADSLAQALGGTMLSFMCTGR